MPAASDLGPQWIHADFCPDNIIVGDGEVTVLDFMMAKTGTVYHDVAHLYMHLDAMKVKPWFRPRGRRPAAARAPRQASSRGSTSNRPLFALMLLQHVICHLVALQARFEPGGPLLQAPHTPAPSPTGWRRSPGSASESWTR